MMSLLSVSSIHEFPSTSIDFILVFPQVDLDTDVLIKLLIVMGVGEERR